MDEKELLELIEKAAKGKATLLDLSKKGIKELPVEIGQLKNLTFLNLSENQLSSLPAEIGQLTNLTELVLSNNQLSELPAEIWGLTNLTKLSLFGNKLTKLLAEIGKLSNLTELNLSANQLTMLPTEIGALSNLTKLSISVNKLATLPAEIGALSNLMELNLSQNQLRSLPTEIGKLSNLTKLSLFYNQLRSLPTEIGQLTNLIDIDLWNNQLVSLPAEFWQLTNLTRLGLDGNQFSSLPAEIGKLTNLIELNLSGNQLTMLPVEIEKLTNLTKLYLHENPALQLPPEVLGPTWQDVTTDKKAAKPVDILEFYFRRRKEGVRPLKEVKVILVGQGSVGKTSLVKKIVTGKFNKREKKTEGIYINKEWSITGKSGKVQVNFWDFGGQEIMHATHQFFLTRRTIYLLVLDARKGENESNIHYWLKIIRSYGGDSPVLVVTNKCETHHLDLDETRLKKDYPNIQGFHKTSCEKGTGIEKLKKDIAKQIRSRKMRHVFDPLPIAYFTIKEKLEKMASDENYIDIRTYYKLCADNGVDKQDEQDLLLRFLHDLGTVLNFNDPENPYSLREMNVLNPEWVTEGVYKILNDKPVAKRGGVLNRKQLKQILKNRKYPQKYHPFIIDMMRKFELCFTVRENEEWLVAELLPRSEPQKLKEDEKALAFRYHYDVLPAGIICRFIVRRYENLTKKPIYWRSGVVLKIEECKVLIRSDTDKRRMFISVTGPEKCRRSALAVVRDEFDRIHATIPNLEPKKMVPLPDDPKVEVGYEHLMTLEKEKVISFIPEGTSRPYNVATLLDGIEDPLDREFGRFHLYPPFFEILPGEDSFADAWEVFCCDVLNRYEKTTEINRRKAPESGVDVLWREKKRAYQCKSVIDPATCRFDVGKAVESVKTALAKRKETGWKKFYICSNVDITGPQEKKLRKACPRVDMTLLTPSFWLPRCREQHARLRSRFSELKRPHERY
jgi:internalin A